MGPSSPQASPCSQPLPGVTSIQLNLGPPGHCSQLAPKTQSAPDLHPTSSPCLPLFLISAPKLSGEKFPIPCSPANSFYLTSTGHITTCRLSPHLQLGFYLIFQSPGGGGVCAEFVSNRSFQPRTFTTIVAKKRFRNSVSLLPPLTHLRNDL